MMYEEICSVCSVRLRGSEVVERDGGIPTVPSIEYRV